ncbi:MULTISPECIES: hypothetical protein [unclassified Pseudomonas]|uniref:hypothetical protein n=1 Tax=unclassified Pseudomonas TaxID=196821 RepID=UPI002AC966CC|nr:MULTISPECIES: hypothetical protein [unclassified Pseudomonas]MEB0040341.1 hypothetical protein [Pseudomonas sp. MH10]MEB0077372.1 hypothetical protein [Pseudomonas sp. MH10out]MEB0092846.1 hypothetical protein [Pseudomonas sp. CCI4.2]MEB0101173.1 hypothetical protein [Pseudomonas sp. CCI3.2]MEB0120550.1 hypothetical protein [Pseudomonas sp. CCI1.2]
MKVAVITLFGCMVLAGCSGSGSHSRACEVLVPAQVTVPTTQNDQRVEEQATGEPTDDRNQEQNCP